MNIFYVMGMDSTKLGGLETFFIKLQRQNPDDKFILAYNHKPTSDKFINTMKAFGGEIEILDTTGLGIVRNIFKYMALLLKYKPKIVHFHFQFSYLLYAPLAKVMGVRILVKTFHSCLTRGSNARQIYTKKELSVLYRICHLDGLIFKLFSHIVFVSEYVKNQFTGVFGIQTNCHTIYLGIEEKDITSIDKESVFRELHINESQKIIATTLFASSIKGADVLIKAIPYVADYNTVFVIIGMNEELTFTREMHHLAKQLNVENRIRYVGITNDVCRYLSVTNIYVQPSRTEALGLAACEAISMKLPLVASSVGGLPELTDLLFNVEDSEGLAEILNKLLSNKELCEQESHNAYDKFRTTFIIDRGVEEYLKLYKGN